MSKATPSTLVLAGHGLNCEAETLRAFELAGGTGKIVHVDDLIEAPEQLGEHQILAVPGGFSYGDHTGAGKALANRLAAGLGDAIRTFLAADKLAIGVCNGCQALVKSQLWTDDAVLAAKTSVAGNVGGSYICRWEAMRAVGDNQSPWLAEVQDIRLPIAHGEGRFVFGDSGPIGLTYDDNPNGADGDAAALLGYGGRVLVMMPHPERAVRFTSQPDWTLQREVLRRAGEPIPTDGPGLALFRNAVGYFG